MSLLNLLPPRNSTTFWNQVVNTGAFGRQSRAQWVENWRTEILKGAESRLRAREKREVPGPPRSAQLVAKAQCGVKRELFSHSQFLQLSTGPQLLSAATPPTPTFRPALLLPHLKPCPVDKYVSPWPHHSIFVFFSPPAPQSLGFLPAELCPDGVAVLSDYQQQR